MKKKEQLRNYLAQGKTKKVIIELLVLSKNDIDLHNDVIAISARYEKYLKEKFANIVPRQDLEVENNGINGALLNIINIIQDDNDRITKFFRKYDYGFIIMGSFMLLFLIFKFSSITFFNNRTTDVTVFVVGQKGCTDFVLREKGKVIMRNNRTGETKSESISDKGEAKFSGLYDGEKVTLEIDFSEPYRSINKDTVYIISDNKSICLVVKLQNLDKISGKVIYNNLPLKGVNVSINSSIFDQTDSLGNYDLDIPLEFQKKQQEVFFYKKEFKLEKCIAYPQTQISLPTTLTKIENK